MTNSNIFKNKKLWKRVLAGALAGLIAITSTNLDFAAMRAYATESVADPTPSPTSTPEGEGTGSPEVTPTVTPETMVTPEVTPTVTPETTVTPEVTPTDTPEVTPTVTPEATVTPTTAPVKKLLGAPKAAPAPVKKGTILLDGEPFGQRIIKYGDKLNLSVADVDGDITYKYLPSNQSLVSGVWSNVEFSGEYCLLAPGEYYFGYVASDNVNKSVNGEYKLTVEKAKIGDASKIKLERTSKEEDRRDFNLTIESAKPLKTTTDGYLTSDAILDKYFFKLYKKVGDTFEYTGDHYDTSAPTYDITSTIKDTVNHGYGTYKVSVNFTSNKPDYYLSSDETFSEEFIYRDEYMPEITDYTYSKSAGNYSLTATISDTGSGLAKYAFSTATSAEGVDTSDWTSVADADKAKSLSVTKEIEEGGIYYLYVKDIYGNCTKSDKSIAVTKLIYHNLYSGSALMSPQPVDYLLARSDEDRSIDIRAAIRKGHAFLKWTARVGSVDNTLEKSITIDKNNATYWGKTVDLTAVWSMNTVTVTVSSDNTECLTETGKQYDASDVTLSAIISGIEKGEEDSDITYEYQWYYSEDGNSYAAITENGTNSTYLVKNVNQSGFYKVEVTVTVGDATSDVATGLLDKKVTITKKPLSISVNPKTITFGDELPAEMSAYTFTYDGLVEGDEASVTHNDEVPAVESSDYTAGSSVGTNAYKIKPHGFTSNNYDITMSETQNLSVTAKDASGFSVTLDNDSYNYDGNVKKPVPALIKDGDIVLLDINAESTVEKIKGGEIDQPEYDYILSYPAHILAGNTKVVLTFRRNYTGSIEVPYTISQSGYDVNVTIKGWKYGEFNPETNSPVVVPKINGTEAPIDIPDKNKHFVYRTVTGESTYSTEYQDMPMDAGKYQVKVRIDELANYTAQESDWTDFEITKRNIILKSEDYTWDFDNNTHSSTEKNPVTVSVLDTYTKDGIEYRNDGLKDPDHYAQNPAANVTVKEVNGEGVPNTISYSFTTSTKESNYNVIMVEGTLKVVPATLVAPSELQWNSINTGTATWVGVTKSGVTIEYHVRLYKDSTLITPSSESGYYDTSDVDSFVTTKTSIDFKDIIRSNSEDSLGTYTFTVQAVPVYGEDSVRNYKASAFSAQSAGLHTAKIEMDKTTGVAAALVADSSAYVIIEGESLDITMEPAVGYTEADPAWVVTKLTEVSNVETLVIKDAKDKTTSVTFARGTSDNMQFKVVAHANDVAPTSVWDFGPDYSGSSKDSAGKSYTDDMSRIYVNISMTDAIGVTKYRIVKVANESDFETNRSSYEKLDSNWTNVPSESKTSYSFNYKITEPGSYYVGAVDNTESITWSEPCTVYQINFEHGDVDEAKADGDMQSILKVKDFDIVHLPANEFTYSGFAFTEWKVKDADRVYVDGGMYPLNVSTTLVAKWSDKKYPYTINYHLMSVDGTYPDAASETKEFTSLYGQKQYYTKSAANRDITGYSIDSIKMGDEVISKQVTEEGKTRTDAEINITAEGQVYDVYYKRNEYAVKYIYTDENNEEHELKHKENYLYEKALSVAEGKGENLANAEISTVAAGKPGYRFTGWTYDGSGTRPTNMPAHDVIVTGKFVPEEARYNVHYYVKSANGSDYSERKDLAHTYSGSHDEEIIFKTAAGESDSENTFVPEKIDGYNFKGIATVYGAGSPEESSVKTITAKVNAKEGETLNIYYFCEPAEYTVTLNVWLGSDHTGKMYSGAWTYKYGQTLSLDMLNEMSKYYEDYYLKESTPSHIEAPTNVESSSESTVGYILSDSISWSTGTAPAVMPAGNINITREYVKDSELEYLVRVYFQNEQESYNSTPTATVSYYAPEGAMVSVKAGSAPADDSYNVYLEQFRNLVAGFTYYELDKVTALDGTDIETEQKVTKKETGKSNLELNIYFKRKEYNLKVVYWAHTTGNENVKIAEETLTGVWKQRITTIEKDGDVTHYYSGFDPLKYFDNANYKTANDKTYKADEYIVSYTYDGSYAGTPFWNRYQFNTVASLTGWYASADCTKLVFPTANDRVINVYYTKPDSSITFGVNIVMKEFGADAAQPLKYVGALREGDTETTEYTYKFVNTSEIYGKTDNPGLDFSAYPGLKHLKQPPTDITYGSSAKTEYTPVNTQLYAYHRNADDSTNSDGYEYYIKDNTDEKVIYIIRPTTNNPYESLIEGSYYSFNINYSAPYRLAVEYLDGYNAVTDHTVKIKFSNTSTTGRQLKSTSAISDGTLQYSFERTEVKILYHKLINNSCSGHEIAKGTKLNYTQLSTCGLLTDNANQKPGYEIRLFSEQDFDDAKIITPSSTIPTKYAPLDYDQTVFAQYFKKTIPHDKYIYFELADSVVSGGEEINYLDKSMVSSVTDGKATATVGGKSLKLVVSTTTGTPYTISYEQNGRTYNQTVTPSIDTYTYNGSPVMVVEHHENYSFTSISLDTATYEKPGVFSFDSKAGNNVTNAYIESSAIDLIAHYERVNYSISRDDNNVKNSKDFAVRNTYKNGQTVRLDTPVYNGFDFNGWTIKDTTDAAQDLTVKYYDNSDNEVVASKATYALLTMPTKDIKAVAQWVPGAVNLKYLYYFQNSSKQYEETYIDTLLACPDSKIKDVELPFDGVSITLKGYYSSSDVLLGVSKDGYFYKVVNGAVDSSNLVGMIKNVASTTGETEGFGEDHVSEDVKALYELNSATCTNEITHDVVKESADVNNFTVSYGQVIKSYYARTKTYSVNLVGKATDNSEADVTLAKSIADGSIFYGDSLTISATPAVGYKFIGWYLASDVIADDKLIAGYASKTKYNSSPSFEVVVKSDLNLVAVVEPEAFSTPPEQFANDVKISLSTEKDTYDYGYTDGKNLHAAVEIPTTANKAIYVSKYSWYKSNESGEKVGDPIQVSELSDYKFNEKNAGTYYYTCEVEFKRKDNGRTINVMSKTPKVLKIEVTPVEIKVKVTSVNCVYDGENHKINVELDKENYPYLSEIDEKYTIVYSEDPIDEGNKGSSTEITKKDVKLDGEGNRSSDPYTIYYSVVPSDEIAANYVTATGTGTIKISPKTVTVKETTNGFNKLFDDTAVVTGDLSTSSSDKYKLSYGKESEKYYALTGICACDTDSVTMDFEANYNSKHVNDAGTVTLTDLKIVNKSDKKENLNYKFADGDKLVIPGEITQKELDITWDINHEDSCAHNDDTGIHYAYNGQTHLPVPSISTGVPTGFDLVANNGNINAGTYTAIASLKANAEDADPKDYKLINASCEYKINVLAVAITAKDKTDFVYDRTSHTLNEFIVDDGTGEKILSSGAAINSNYSFTAKVAQKVDSDVKKDITSVINAGTYTMEPIDVKIIDKAGKDVTDNFNLTINAGTLTINKKPVTVEGITVSSRKYDGTLDATPVFGEGVKINGVIEGDKLRLDQSKITAKFKDANVGNEKDVLVSIPENALIDVSTGAVSINYTVEKAEGKEAYEQPAKQDITIANAILTLGVEDINAKYGGEIDFKVVAGSESGLSDATSAIDVWGDVVFTIKDSDGNVVNYFTHTIAENSKVKLNTLEDIKTDTIKLSTGTYKVSVNVEGLKSQNYTFANASVVSKLKIGAKVITLTPVSEVAEDKALSKSYDKTTAVGDTLKNKIKQNKSNVYFTFEGIEGGDEVSLTTFDAIFDDSNVKSETVTGAKKITISNIKISNPNYSIASDATLDIPASITPVGLTLTVQPVTATYGDTKESVLANAKVEASGLISEDTLAGVVSYEFSTEYDDTDSAKRGITSKTNSYQIKLTNVSLLGNANYSITTVPAALTINPKKVQVSVARGTLGDNVSYTEGNSGATSVVEKHDRFSMTYGGEISPDWFVPKFDGFKYGESADTAMSDAVAYMIKLKTGDIVIEKGASAQTPGIAGDYLITPVLTGVTKDNYIFEPVVDKYIVINKKSIFLDYEFISILDKVYDAKRTVPADRIRFSGDSNKDVTMSYATNEEENTDLHGDKADIQDYAYLQNGAVGQILLGDITFLRDHNLTGLVFDTANTLFDSKDVNYSGTTIIEREVTLEYKLCNYLDDRYVIVADPVRQTKANAKITPAPLTIKAKVKAGNGVSVKDGVPTLYYGTAVPEFENEYVTFVTTEGGTKETTEVLEKGGTAPSEAGTTKENTTTGEKWRTTYKGVVNDYSQANESGVEYTVIPYGFAQDASSNNKNYKITYEKCNFKVITAKLATPNVTWVSGKPGIVKFAGVSSIGDVKVDHYELKLYKGEEVIETVARATAGNEYNLLETIRTNGAGAYKVGVTAYAQTDNNASYTNVAANSDEGKSSVIYAAELTLKPATDEKSADTVAKSSGATVDANRVKMEVQRASDENKNSAYITGADSAVTVTVVQGEQIPVSLDTENTEKTNVLYTGYRVLKLSSANEKVTFDSSAEATGWPYSNAINIGAIGSGSPIEVKVLFNHVEAAISASLTMSNHQGEVKTGLSDTFMYGYSAVPDMTVNVAIDTTKDTVGTDGYTYSYVWHVIEQGEGIVSEENKGNILSGSDTANSKSTSCTKQIKTGVKVGTYFVYCTVTAKRKDNGIETSYDTLAKLGESAGLFGIDITPSPLTAAVQLSTTSWTYGDARAEVSVTGINSDSIYKSGDAAIKYYYSNTSELGDPEEWSETSHPSNWKTTMITDANTDENPKWYVVAYIPPQPNYSQLVTVAQPYTISKATLGMASDILLSTDKDSYGKVQWTAAPTINENTDATPTASKVVPNYEVTVKWRATSSDSFADITNGTFNVGTVEANITDLMQNNGEYEITIKSVPNATNAKDVQNSESKDPDSIATATFKVGNITVPEGEQYEKTYDGNPITLTASFEDTVGSYQYQWYVTKSTGTELVDGATSATINITNVADSGKYFCVGTKDSTSYVTVLKEVKINKRNLTITATAKEDYVYDGTEKTSEAYTNSADLQNGDKITSVTFSGKRIDAGTVDNVPSDAFIKNSAGTEEETNNYNITYVKANLTVKPRPVTLTWSTDAVGTWTDFATTYSSSERSITASISNKAIETDEVSVATYKSTGSNVNKATNQGTYTAIAETLTGDNADNYTLDGATGNNQSWTINKANIRFTAGADDSTNSWIYDGTEHKNNTYKTYPVSLQGSDKVSSVTYGTDSVVKNVSDSGDAKNTITAVTIKNGDIDVTDNYNISYVAGPLTITKRAIKLTADNKSSVYGADLSALTYTPSRVPAGTTGDAIIAADKDGLGIKLTTTADKTRPVGNYPITISYTVNENYDITLEHEQDTDGATFGRYQITNAALNVTAKGYEDVYDGRAHGISVTATAPAGGKPTIYYSTTEITDDNFESVTKQTDNITYVDVKVSGDKEESYTVYYYVKCDNYNSVKGSKTVKITKRPITLTAKTGSHEYDGTAYSLKEYDVTSDKKVASTDKIDSVSMTASVTNVSDNAVNNNTISNAKIVRISDTSKDVTGNYNITYVAGKISITPATDTITVTNDIGKEYSGTPVANPEFSKNDKNTGTPSYIYYKKTGETYSDISGAPTDAGDYAVEVKISGDNNYVDSTSAKKDFTITKKPITITAKSVTNKVYDGKALTFADKTVAEGIENSGALCDGHILKSITFSGSVTDVADVAVDNAISNAFICTKDNQTVNLADNYDITYTAGKLKVIPHPLTRIKLNEKEDNSAEVIFTGEAVGPTIVVEADGIKGATKTLTKDTDYTVTVSDTYKPTAIYPGEYTVQVVGKGNYTGELKLKYTIKDNAAPVISGISKNIYCKDMPVIKVSDKMLKTVEVKVGAEVKKTYTFDPLDPSTPKDSEGNVVQEINSTDLIPSAEGTTYTIVGTDTSGNSESVSVKVYSDHSFVTYNKVTDTSDPNYNSNGLHVVSDCSHNCGGKDYKVKMWGSVEWDYDYPDPNGSGETHVQGVEAREIAAKVELLQDDVVVDTIVVNCADTCGTGAADALPTDFRKFEFGLQPLKDATHDYVYTFKVTIGDLKDGNFVEPTNDLHYAKDTKTDYADANVGHRTIFRYAPSSFDLPWKIVLKDLPVDEDGNTVAPEKVYVKVLFAYTEDADDTDSPAGYQVITQHSGTISVECGGEDKGDGTYTYESSYPVWMYQGAKHISYYYRVQVVGYELDNENYDVTAQGLKSINDKDHEKHTIYYTGTGPSGTITYELNNLLPTLTFDSNNGSDKAFAVIWKGKVGGEVTAAEINAVGKPSYAGYNFVGWYDSKEGGNPVSGDITIGSSNITLYARWSKIASPDNSSDGDDDSTPAPAPAKPKVTPSPVVPEIIAIASPAPSRTQNNPQVTLAVTPAAGDGSKDNGDDSGNETGIAGNVSVSVAHRSEESEATGLEVAVVDEDHVANATLTDDEKKYVENGGNVEVRLVVDNKLTGVANGKDEDIFGNNTKLKSYVSLILEKRVGDGDWERLYRASEPIAVEITIPEELIEEGEKIVLVRITEDGYEYIDDLSDDSLKIMFITNDFESEYALISIPEAQTGTLFNDCPFHWYLLIILLLSTGTVLLYWKKDEDEVDENGEPIKRRGKGHMAAVVLINGVGAVLVYFGHCHYDLPILLASIGIAAIGEVIPQFKKK